MNSIMALPVMELARERVRSVSHEPLWSRIVDAVLRRTAVFAADWLDAKSRKMQDNAVWFVGAAAELDKTDPVEMIDDSGKLLNELHQIEANLLALRQELLKAPMSNVGVFQKAVARQARAASDLYEAVREFRGAYQAYEANCCASLMAHHRVLTTPQEVERELADIIR